ncbi:MULTISPECIES: hypothetical protein [Providencia]|uniref:hypothetical protein n=1 Tax=Providencia TaxID=586 RepID=UPI0008FB67BE|nr:MULTISPECIES: hypothetical protein [Providencia]APC12863.1 hypothetical protein RB151_032050 [Providencia rettgeri]AVL72383.1 hypothetical protein CEQ08_00980 [Providencia rettgeri]EKH6496149.1 hypothetical protein [Providencia rettgeri]ELR5053140.1 hypothetical protein [Providencia rettgeri]ELR5155372.1 hypothetical protein [Providencia rettgeri]
MSLLKLLIPAIIFFTPSIYTIDTLDKKSKETEMNNKQDTMKQIINDDIQLLMSQEELMWPLAFSKTGLHGEVPVTLFRFEPNNSFELFAEHSSILINDKTNELQGFVRLRPQYNKNSPQVTKSEAESIMVNFISQYAPNLKNNYKIQWIDSHDENIIINNQPIIIRGMKVKCRDLNTGLYFWTIIAPDASIMVFEKDIKWDFIRAGRQTQKWLHDEWLAKNNK